MPVARHLPFAPACPACSQESCSLPELWCSVWWLPFSLGHIPQKRGGREMPPLEGLQRGWPLSSVFSIPGAWSVKSRSHACKMCAPCTLLCIYKLHEEEVICSLLLDSLVSDTFQNDQLGAVCWNVESARGVTGLLYKKWSLIDRKLNYQRFVLISTNLNLPLERQNATSAGRVNRAADTTARMPACVCQGCEHGQSPQLGAHLVTESWFRQAGCRHSCLQPQEHSWDLHSGEHCSGALTQGTW